MLKLLLDA